MNKNTQVKYFISIPSSRWRLWWPHACKLMAGCVLAAAEPPPPPEHLLCCNLLQFITIHCHFAIELCGISGCWVYCNRHRMLKTWVNGSLLFTFYVAIFCNSMVILQLNCMVFQGAAWIAIDTECWKYELMAVFCTPTNSMLQPIAIQRSYCNSLLVCCLLANIFRWILN